MIKPELLRSPVPNAERDHDPLTETTISREVVFRSEKGFVQVVKDSIALPDGQAGVRYHLPHPGACAIICYDADGTVILERQWRHPCEQSFWEIPAGKLDPNEDPQACAARELKEECGIEATCWKKLGSLRNAIGYSNEVIHIYLAQGLHFGEPQRDEGEFLEVYRVRLEEALVMCEDGRITDAKTLVGLMWLERHLRHRIQNPLIDEV